MISITEYQRWEIWRYLDSENPGRHGYFTVSAEAA